ncbi:MAG: hypothetical protein NTY39_04215 [Campylobacterales bacterium]|nr:hypothetical protein [Campylobacterales bacterium]
MKRNLGKIVFLWFINTTLAWGTTYQWSVLEQPTSLRVNQSGMVRYACTYDGSASEYSIKMQFVENSNYTASILSQEDKIIHGKRMQTVNVLITPKVAGDFDLKANAIVSFTSLGAIENTVLGRDNVGKNDVVETKVALPSVKIHADENSMALTGKMSLEAHVDQPSVRGYEPLHLTIRVKGSGNLDQFIPYELNISGVKVFAELPQKSISPSSVGYEGEIVQEFALVARESYTIPPFSLSFFDTDKKQVVKLQTKQIGVEVGESYDPSSLLDRPKVGDTTALKQYGIYVVLVVFGILLGEMARRLWKHRPRRKIKHFWDSAKSTKELIMLLSLSGEKRFDEVIAALEEGTMSLGEGKRRLKELQDGR